MDFKDCSPRILTRPVGAEVGGGEREHLEKKIVRQMILNLMLLGASPYPCPKDLQCPYPRYLQYPYPGYLEYPYPRYLQYT